jgi:hypothetical protein
VNAPALLSTIVTAGIAVILAAMVFETWALWSNREPITGYVRGLVMSYPPAAFALAVVIGLLLGHLLWR